MAPLALVGQDDAVLDAAAALEDVGVVGGRVALADDVGAAELEGGGERGGAGPLDILPVVARALVGALHCLDLVQRAQRPSGYAF